MHLVDEQHRVATGGLVLPGPGNGLAYLLHAGQHGGQLQEMGVGLAGGYPRQGGLADAGRTPENHRVQLAAVNGLAQGFARPQHVLLAGVVSKRVGAQPGSQRLIAGGGFARGGGRLRGIAEKAGLGRAGGFGAVLP